MKSTIPDHLVNRLHLRINANLIRTLESFEDKIDFVSGDYLGMARDVEVKRQLTEFMIANPTMHLGSGGSRLLRGHNKYFEELESLLAFTHNAESATFFNSCYDANIGLLSCVSRKGDTYLYDEYSHNSLIMGMKLSGSNMISFRHNDVEDLEAKLKSIKGLVYVVYESLYSMDGDLAKIKEITDVCLKYGAYQIIDEAHSSAIFGKYGEGLVASLGLQDHFFARTHACSKGFGNTGGYVLGSKLLKNYLINYSSSFTYSVSASTLTLLTNIYSVSRVVNDQSMQLQLFKNCEYLKSKLLLLGFNYLKNITGPIFPILMNGELATRELGLHLQMQGYDARPIVFPVVPKGFERIRLCMHAFNTQEEIDGYLNCFMEFFDKHSVNFIYSNDLLTC